MEQMGKEMLAKDEESQKKDKEAQRLKEKDEQMLANGASRRRC